jgi:class 3 adenylate cyclase
MIAALRSLLAPKQQEPRGFSGTGAVMMADSRGITKVGKCVTPEELVDCLGSITTTLIRAVEKKDGIVRQYIGGSLIAYWPPSKMPAGLSNAIEAAAVAVAECGASIAVSVAVGEFALIGVGPAAKRPLLVGAAYQRAEATLRAASTGTVSVDRQTLDALPADIKVQFVMKDGYAELPIKSDSAALTKK